MKIGLIGFGNLGKAFVAGILKSGFPYGELCITARTQKTIDSVKNLYPEIRVCSDKEQLLNFSDLVVLCVEPQNAQELCEEIKKFNIEGKTFLSFMSGVHTSNLTDYLGCDHRIPIIRAMPNLAVSTCNGIIGLSNVVPERDDEILRLLKQLGQTVIAEEDELESITVAGACGLAFASVMLNTYQKAIQKLLLSSELSKEITLQVFSGAISMVGGDISFDELCDTVATKGGSTEAGLANFDIKALNNIMDGAVEAACRIAKKR